MTKGNYPFTSEVFSGTLHCFVYTRDNACFYYTMSSIFWSPFVYTGKRAKYCTHAGLRFWMGWSRTAIFYFICRMCWIIVLANCNASAGLSQIQAIGFQKSIIICSPRWKVCTVTGHWSSGVILSWLFIEKSFLLIGHIALHHLTMHSIKPQSIKSVSHILMLLHSTLVLFFVLGDHILYFLSSTFESDCRCDRVDNREHHQNKGTKKGNTAYHTIYFLWNSCSLMSKSIMSCTQETTAGTSVQKNKTERVPARGRLR